MGLWRKVLGGLALTLLAAVAAACGQAAQSTAGPVVQSFQMIDAQVGWAVGAGGGGSTVLRTIDGGAHWTQVLRKTTITAADFLDGTHAWVLGRSGSFVTMDRTSNGGASWQGIAQR